MWREVELGKESLNVTVVTGLTPNLLGDPSRNAHFDGVPPPGTLGGEACGRKKVPPAVKWDNSPPIR
jgi:hypothetical protein